LFDILDGERLLEVFLRLAVCSKVLLSSVCS
jgi:hypothetical protein